LRSIRACSQLLLVRLLAQSSLENTPQTARLHVQDRPNFSSRLERFTQGLATVTDFSTKALGLQGRSSLRKVRLETGEVLQRVDLAPEFFGEELPC